MKDFFALQLRNSSNSSPSISSSSSSSPFCFFFSTTWCFFSFTFSFLTSNCRTLKKRGGRERKLWVLELYSCQLIIEGWKLCDKKKKKKCFSTFFSQCIHIIGESTWKKDMMKFSEVLNIPKSIHMYVFNYKVFFFNKSSG